MRMTIARALKEKNRIVGEMNRIRSVIAQRNRIQVTVPCKDGQRPEGITKEVIASKRKVDVNALMGEFNALRDRLVALKTEISKANAKAAHILVALSEAKSELTLLEQFNCGDSDDCQYGANNWCFTDFVFDSLWLENAKRGATAKVNALQDQIDEFNATTFIDVPETQTVVCA